MADGLSTAVADAALATITGTDANYVQLHTGAPGSAGTSNVSSTTSREAVAWNSASGGEITASEEPAWTDWGGDSGEMVTDISFWSISSSGAFGFSMELSAEVTMDTGDSLTLTSISITIPTSS